MTIWTIQSDSAAPPESKAMSVTQKTRETGVLLQTALKQQQGRDSQGAARTYRRVLDLDPDNKFAWYGLGIIAQTSGNTFEARAAYDKALKIDPSFMSALFSEAMMLKSSDPDRAVGLLKRAVAAQPKAATIHMQIGQILAAKGRDSEAKDAFRSAVAADPSLRPQVPEPYRDSVSHSPTSSPPGSIG
ncbi:tetratricopeptide repeat protein [Streptomyces chiangmaiensis]|uniref:Tetratricopeptide repeat protein n=1 Tax=Streptomyces chiangmaiensis TaxID=766497 RepID=A0ABU7FAE4_9ACTN|nr:tetratricopeptide repeat protein [Streptomyces chiangmaiensis]MED7821156.1 tetratricopeptide repeat protein [Streptomyces chiangmaiensis]